MKTFNETYPNINEGTKEEIINCLKTLFKMYRQEQRILQETIDKLEIMAEREHAIQLKLDAEKLANQDLTKAMVKEKIKLNNEIKHQRDIIDALIIGVNSTKEVLDDRLDECTRCLGEFLRKDSKNKEKSNE